MRHPWRAAMAVLASLGAASMAMAQQAAPTTSGPATSSPPKSATPESGHGGGGHPPPQHCPPPLAPRRASPALPSRSEFVEYFIDEISHGGGGHPPPKRVPPPKVGLPQSFPLASEANGTTSTDRDESAVRAAAAFAHDAHYGAWVVVYSGAVGSRPREDGPAERRAALIARQLVAGGVYPGSIWIVWGERPHQRGATIVVRQMTEGF